MDLSIPSRIVLLWSYVSPIWEIEVERTASDKQLPILLHINAAHRIKDLFREDGAGFFTVFSLIPNMTLLLHWAGRF